MICACDQNASASYTLLLSAFPVFSLPRTWVVGMMRCEVGSGDTSGDCSRNYVPILCPSRATLFCMCVWAFPWNYFGIIELKKELRSLERILPSLVLASVPLHYIQNFLLREYCVFHRDNPFLLLKTSPVPTLLCNYPRE